MHARRWLVLPVVLSMALVMAVGSGATQASVAPHGTMHLTRTENEEDPTETLLDRAEQYQQARTAPGTSAPAAAFAAAVAAARAMPKAGGAWTQITTQPYQNDDPNYRDPVWSNSGAGWNLVSGRITALAADGGTVWAGSADGGVWRSTDGGATWTPTTDTAFPQESIGAVAVNPSDHSVWVGTGEANTSSDSYKGSGVYTSNDGGATWIHVGKQELNNALVYRVVFDGVGRVYAATSQGLYRRSASNMSKAWTLVLKPDPNPNNSPYRTSHITDVLVRNGTGGKTVLAVLGWRGGTLSSDLAYNGFYESTNSGAAGTFSKITPTGDIDPSTIGRTTFAQSSDGGTFYAVIESTAAIIAPSPRTGYSLLQGVYQSHSIDGPWVRIADAKELAKSGSALLPFGQFPGIQAWYNQFITVDPNDADHVYLGLEEVFETANAGNGWRTIGPYWNFTLPCYAGGLNDCPPTTHPDQHAVAIADGTVWVGNDGGVWSRPVSAATGWSNHNADLHTLQYYYAGVGPVNGGDAIWGGLQDNGESLLLPGASQMVSPFGGDGGDTFVDPTDGTNALNEYVGLDIILTTNGGVSDGTTPAYREISPSCGAYTYTPHPCDPAPRFIAPYRADVNDPTHWVAGGRYIWEDRAGWSTTCSSTSCDWKRIHDTLHSTTALAVNGRTIYAGWCGPCNPGGSSPFASGIDTNAGGSWHTMAGPLPSRFLNALTVDPADASHVYAVYNGFSRRWIPSAGTGHVFESHDGGASWADISGNLPDVPGDDLVLWNGLLVLATDIGVFQASEGNPTHWFVLGTGLPNTSVNDLTLSPDGSYLVAATHGRGLWKITP